MVRNIYARTKISWFTISWITCIWKTQIYISNASCKYIRLEFWEFQSCSGSHCLQMGSKRMKCLCVFELQIMCFEPIKVIWKVQQNSWQQNSLCALIRIVTHLFVDGQRSIVIWINGKHYMYVGSSKCTSHLLYVFFDKMSNNFEKLIIWIIWFIPFIMSLFN